MKSIIAYSASTVYPLSVNEATLIRRYEEQEYAFIAGDLKLDCSDAQDIYDAVVAGENVSLVVKDGDDVKFRGSISSDGAAYNPETEAWTLSSIHQAKRIFALLKLRLEWTRGSENTTKAFDDLSTLDFHAEGVCDVSVDLSAFFFHANAWPGEYVEFLKKNPRYNSRDYLIDLAKHFRAVVYIDNAVPPIHQLHFVSRQVASSPAGPFDDLIAEYSEAQKDADYSAAFFPCLITRWADSSPAFALYVNDDVEFFIRDSYRTRLDQLSVWPQVHFLSAGESFNLPEKVLDLRVPRAAYPDGMPDSYIFPFNTVPYFRTEGYVFLEETPLEYCDRHFKHLVHGCRNLNVLYHDPIDIDPLRRMIVRGQNIVVDEIQDDLVNETTRILGRVIA